ncbi:MAG: hypothetical protein JSU72_07575, partial [Deltaproteobacteria bacterium]
VPRSCRTGPGAPPATAGEVAQTLRTHSEKTPEKAEGTAAKQRASEQPSIAYLSPTKACMKIWRFLNRDIAIKWRKIARCGAAFPEARAHVLFGESPGTKQVALSPKLFYGKPFIHIDNGNASR